MTSNESAKWQVAFWVVTVGLFGLSVTGYFKLDAKIASAQEEVTFQKKEDLDKIYKQIDKIEDKVEVLRKEQQAMRSESNTKFTQILISLEQLKVQGRNN